MKDQLPTALRSPAAAVPALPGRFASLAGNVRWVVCGLLFLGVTKNYMDRQVLGVLKAPPANLRPATLLLGLATAAHPGFSANLYTLTSDLFPSRAVGSVVGIGGMTGALGGMLIAQVVGHVLEWTGYAIPFFIAAVAYLAALAAIHVLSPRLEPARIAAE